MNSTSKADVHPGLGPRRLAVPGRLVLRVGNLPLPAEVLLALPAANQEDIAIYYAALRV